MAAEVLIIDDDLSLCVAFRRFLQTHGYQIRVAHSGETGLELCAEKMPSLVLLDLNLPDINGLETLRSIKETDAACPVVMMTAYQTAPSVVQAMRLGADDYLTKPVPMQELLGVVAKLVGQAAPEMFQRGKGAAEILGESQPMQQVFDLIRRISKTSATVLITGESGTGKEAVARTIHLNSGRGNRPFLSLNCASIPANLMEAELFGHEKGAFTDAKVQKKGLLEVADGGTILLDEIGLMPLDLQGKILTVLETRRYRRLGGTRELEANIRFLAATNADLEQTVEDGTFREDLYYRLNVIPVHLPPLRDRGDDILLLARSFLDEFHKRHGRAPRTMSPKAQVLLKAYPWPGNVRELKNVIERAVLLSDSQVIDATDMSIDRRQDSDSEVLPVEVSDTGLIRITFPPWGLPLEDLERQVIEEALNHTGGNISKAARLLHISRYTLKYRMQKHGIDSEIEVENTSG